MKTILVLKTKEEIDQTLRDIKNSYKVSYSDRTVEGPGYTFLYRTVEEVGEGMLKGTRLTAVIPYYYPEYLKPIPAPMLVY
jgi:hypothetical protein